MMGPGVGEKSGDADAALPDESLAGLASLAKGAYFEQLVANGTGGALHEHFNHPSTDITIDGVAYQIKATADAGYVDSVPAGIPVITSSEIADLTSSIDGGYTDEEMSRTVELALGGTVVDVGDTSIDAALSLLGGLGLMSTIRGINHAADSHSKGRDPVESALEGLVVAVDGTASSVVGTVELGYKAPSSRPSRFVGRKLLHMLRKLDKRLMG